jgi:hypothetical protein
MKRKDSLAFKINRNKNLNSFQKIFLSAYVIKKLKNYLF